MKSFIRRWSKDERGTSFEGIALSVSIIAVGFVASADVLDYMTKKHGSAIGAGLHEVAGLVSPAMRNPGVDYEPTASIAGQRIVLDPCTGQRK